MTKFKLDMIHCAQVDTLCSATQSVLWIPAFAGMINRRTMPSRTTRNILHIGYIEKIAHTPCHSRESANPAKTFN